MKTKITTLLLGLVLIATTITVAGTQKYTQLIEPETTLTDWWPMYHHDLANLGVSGSATAPTNLTQWAVPINTSADFDSSPAVYNGKVYFGSNDGNLYCVNSADGSMVWSSRTDGFITSSPAVADGKVYVGSYDAKVYCFDALTGTKIWEYTTGASIQYSSPAVFNNRVYIGSFDNKIYCLNATGNGDGTTTKIWDYTTGGQIYSSPAVVDNKVYIGSNDGKVYCLDAVTGVKIWHYTTGGAVRSSPTIANAKVYFFSNDNYAYCVDAIGSGGSTALIWKYLVSDSRCRHAPAFYNGDMFFSTKGNLYCLDGNGNGDGTTTEHWVQPISVMGLLHYSAPAIAAGKIYAAAPDGTISCFDAVTGEFFWKITLATKIYSSPAIVDGFLYVTTPGAKNIVCLGRINFAPPKPVTPTGELNPVVLKEYTYTSQPVIDPDGDTVQYQFDWHAGGYHIYSEWLPTPQAAFAWWNLGQYQIKIRARDPYFTTPWSDPLSITVINNAPNAPTITAPDKGAVTKEYDFTFASQDPDNHQVTYQVNWGDGSAVDIFGPYNSGQSITVKHKWNIAGTYTVIINATDSYYTSQNSNHVITIKNVELEIGEITGGLFKVSAPIKNSIDVPADAINVKWNITLSGGAFIFKGKEASGTIASLASGESTLALDKPVFGFGVCTITVRAKADNTGEVQKEADGFIFLFWVSIKNQ
ncbi:MAG: PQQ-binding-like beta-propeller repeat protein [Candidatus Thermoplasmatota archaeon]